jgi:two-component system invasion response regulator UvrY
MVSSLQRHIYTNNERIKLLIVDDQNLFNEALSKVLHLTGAFEKIDSLSNGREIVNKLSSEEFDVMLLDILMPHFSGLDTLKLLRTRFPHQKVIILTQFENESVLREAFKLGISGFIYKTSRTEEVLRALKLVFDGNEYYTPEIRYILSSSTIVETKLPPLPLNQLNEHELSVLLLTVRQFSLEEIAYELGLSTSSIKKYRSSLLEKTNSRNAIGLMHYALKYNLIKVDEL